MAQTTIGAVKVFCNRHNIPLKEYEENIKRDLKWCVGCGEWHNIKNFGIDNSRYDKLSSSCLLSRKLLYRKKYIKTGRKSLKGMRYAKIRHGDIKQARHRVNHLVEIGLLPKPNTLPCADCGHIYKKGERRHEYDHYKGYSGENQEIVECVCTVCHHKREKERNRKCKKLI